MNHVCSKGHVQCRNSRRFISKRKEERNGNEPVKNRQASRFLRHLVARLARWTPTGSGEILDRCTDPGDVARATPDPRGFRDFLTSASD